MPLDTTDWVQMGKRIRALRLERGLSQEELAEPNYAGAYMSLLESGKRRPSRDVLEHVSARLGVTVEQLISGRDPNADLALEVEIEQATALMYSGKVDEAERRLAGCVAQAKEAGHDRALLRAREAHAQALYRLGDVDASIAEFSSAEELAIALDSATTPAIVGKARCLFQRGEVRDAIHALESHLIDLRASRAPNPTALVETYAALIPGYLESGLADRAKDAVQRGSALASQVDDPEALACLYVNRAAVHLERGDRREALASLALARDLYQRLGWHAQTVKITVAKAMVHADKGELKKAERLLSEVLELPDEVLTVTDRARALTQLAHIRRKDGHSQDALELTRRALDVAGDRVPIEAAEALRERGMASAELGDDAAAAIEWGRALELFEQAGHREEAAKTARLLGDHLRNMGKLDVAVDVYRRGLEAVAQVK